jgi:glycosyltransferase involved in cell wall biosynthesis
VLISIITPCLNRALFVSEAVESVLQQDFADVEHIVMDGGSTDGSLEILSRYPHLRAYSQPDKGIYDALNKGIRLANGDVLGFLNTDDFYEPNILKVVAKAFTENPQLDGVVGGASIFSGNSPDTRVTMMEFPCVPPNQLLRRATVGAPIFNAWFLRRRLLEELEGFDSRYRYVADRDLLIRMAYQGCIYASIDQPFYHYRMHSGSYTLSGEESGEAAYMFETRRLAENYLRRKGLRSGEKKHFKAWHSQIMMEQIITAVHKKAFHRAVGYLLTGLLYDFGLLAIFASEVSKWISVRFPRNSDR